MNELRTAMLFPALILWCACAQAAECDANFGAHPIPPVPIWAPLVDDPPWGQFQWGADAYSDPYGQWWRASVIRNGDAKQLVIGWDKAGISFDSRSPLPPGKKHCKYAMLSFGPQLVPVLDNDAPIIYGGSRSQEAAVYVQRIQAGGLPPQGAGVPVNPVSSEGQKDARAVTRVETFYRDEKGKELPASIILGTFASSGKFSLSIEKAPKELIVGITALANVLDSERVEALQSEFQNQGFVTWVSTLSDAIGPDGVKSLFWSNEKIAPDGKVIFLTGGPPKGQFTFSYSSETLSQRQGALLVILDQNKQAIAADSIDLIVPQSRR